MPISTKPHRGAKQIKRMTGLSKPVTTFSKSKLADLCARAQRDVDAGLEHGGVQGCALALAYESEIVFERGFGEAKSETPMLIWSPTKTVIEAALWLLYGTGQLQPSDPVIKFIPEFGSNGKATITLEMIETHTSAFAKQPLDFPDFIDRQKRLEAFKNWKVEGVPGTFYEYHPGSGAWVLAEVIESVTGRDYREFLKSEVLRPLGLADLHKLSLGEPQDLQCATLKPINCIQGWTPDPAKRPPLAHSYQSERALAVRVPGSGAVGTPSGLALLYQAYLHNPGKLWNGDILDDAKHTTRVRMPDVFGRPMVRSLSFCQADEIKGRYGERTFFGTKTSARAFGHQGQGGQIVWADPATGVSFSYLTNTIVFPPGGCFHPRAQELSTLAAAAFNR